MVESHKNLMSRGIEGGIAREIKIGGRIESGIEKGIERRIQRKIETCLLFPTMTSELL